MTNQAALFEIQRPTDVDWTPDIATARNRLAAFIPNAGRAYARDRNFDLGVEDRSNVSALSPWLRHRLITEEEVLRETFKRHSYSMAEKFVQEVFWRGYFKGWLEHRPVIWSQYRQTLVALAQQYEKDASLARRYDEAVAGKTGIACFDNWADELVETGYLHNHARMWFASIWIYTLKLPWELGADFFYRHLLDGDPASNTCSWRWVGGLHTMGKTYLARASNIETFTRGRFNPAGQLAPEAQPLRGPALPQAVPPQFEDMMGIDLHLRGRKVGLVITEEDCSLAAIPQGVHPTHVIGLSAPSKRSVWPTGEIATRFAPGAVESATASAVDHFAAAGIVSDGEDWGYALSDWAQENGLDTLIVSRPPIGPVRKRLIKARKRLSETGIGLIEVTHAYDEAVWRYTKAGFFGLKKKIPTILEQLSI